jgi:hypothetical protein
MTESGPTANFCTECGQPIHGGKFCSNCGTPSGVHQAVTPALAAAAASGAQAGEAPTEPLTNGAPKIEHAETAETPAVTQSEIPVVTQSEIPAVATAASPAVPPPAAAAPPARGGMSRGLIIALVAGAVAIVGVVAAVLVAGSGGGSKESSNADAVYQKKVATAFGPVLGANQQLSDALAAVRGTDPADAKVAVSRSQHATTVASGAISALTPPTGSAALAREARQVLDREAAYLAAISAVLNHPSVAGASQLQTLASNLTSALDSAGPTVAGTSPTVTGADRLTAWARSTSRTLSRRAAAARRKAAAENSGSSATTTTRTIVVSPYSNGGNCGSGVFAGPKTSCAFALNVRRAYQDSGGSSTVNAYSPTTGRTYTMHCARSGGSVTCLGGDDASVTF